MKKFLSVLMLLAISVCLLVSCVDTSNDDQGKGNASQGSSSGNLGDYNVIIESCRLGVDYENDPIVIVKYKFTNVSDDEAASFWLSVDDKVYQDGIGLNKCYVADDSANYSEDNQSKEIKKGNSIYVEVAYELNDTSTDIEVEVSEYISFNDKKVVKTFSINN